MPRYFFDIVNGGPHRDDVGVECASDDEMRSLAMRTLPDIASEQIAGDGDRRTFTVIVRDAAGQPIYSATLSYTGLRLRDRAD